VRWRRWGARLALLLGLGLVFFVFGWAPFWLGGMATLGHFRFPDTENAGLTPDSFHLAYEAVSFRAADGVEIKGWWVPAPEAKGSVVLVHGVNRSRIEMVKKTPFLHQHGWNSLLLDLRGHGESGAAATTFGVREKEDVRAAVRFSRSRADVPVVLWGVSLGGATVVLTAADDPNVAGVVCDSSYRSLRDTVHHHLDLLRSYWWWLGIVPTWPAADEVVFWMGQRGGFDPDAVDIRAAAARLVGRPALFVANSGDRRMPSEIAFELKAAAGDDARVLVIPSESHGGAYRDGRPQYESAVAQVLEEALHPRGAQQLASRH